MYLFLLADLFCCAAVLSIFYSFYSKSFNERSAYISIIFGIACALAGIAGTLVGPTYQVVVYMGYIILLKAFASAVVGGFGSLPGAIVGGFTVGLFETACSFFISGSHKDAYAFLLMVVVLLIKPTGFFGVQVKMKA